MAYFGNNSDCLDALLGSNDTLVRYQTEDADIVAQKYADLEDKSITDTQSNRVDSLANERIEVQNTRILDSSRVRSIRNPDEDNKINLRQMRVSKVLKNYSIITQEKDKFSEC
jgi:hypothetical protein